MERPAVAFEGMEIWESNDQGCEIMLRHLEEARAVARNADTYSYNAKRVLQGKTTDQGCYSIPYVPYMGQVFSYGGLIKQLTWLNLNNSYFLMFKF